MNRMQFVFLWTDVLVYLLVGVVLMYALRARRLPHLAAPWRRLARRPAAMGAAVVLAAYLVIGLLDSVHFRVALSGTPGQAVVYSPEVWSVLDWLAAPLKEGKEKTYSAPLATRLYSKEAVELPDGHVVRDYPRLTYGGAHLEDESAWDRDVRERVLVASAVTVAVAAVLVLAVVWRLKRVHGEGLREASIRLAQGRTTLPLRTMLGVTVLLLWLVALAITLGSGYHVLGTDKVGQDVLYVSLKSVRTGLLIGTLTTLVMLPFALVLGIMAGYFRGWVDDLIQYLYTTLNSIPGVLLIAAAVLVLQVRMDQMPELTLVERADLRLLFLCMILGVTSWTSLCRLLRAETLKLVEMDFVQAAHAFGVHPLVIMARHIAPNVMHIVIITLTLEFSSLVLAEAVLAYVGVGVDPSMHSWGNMINGARLELAREPVVWWLLTSAFGFMFVLVLAANLFSDAVRDAFDPRSTYQVLRGKHA